MTSSGCGKWLQMGWEEQEAKDGGVQVEPRALHQPWRTSSRPNDSRSPGSRSRSPSRFLFRSGVLQDPRLLLDERVPRSARASSFLVVGARLTPPSPQVNGAAVLNKHSYNFRIFETPSLTKPWGLTFFGHHLCLAVTIVGKRMVISPVRPFPFESPTPLTTFVFARPSLLPSQIISTRDRTRDSVSSGSRRRRAFRSWSASLPSSKQRRKSTAR